MQHLEARAQVAYKEKVLLDTLWHIGKVRPESIIPPIYGPTWHYRHRARLTVRDVPKKGGVLVGFHEKASSYVCDMKSCKILPKHVSDMLVPMRELVSELSIRQRMPQIEVAVGGDGRTALVFRTLETPTPEDMEKLLAFGDKYGADIWLQPKGPESAHAVRPEAEHALGLYLSEFNVRIGFKPTDFTQVNHALNETMVSRAVRLLGVEPHHHLFTWCEADWDDLRARYGTIDRVLIDPPREGALALARTLAATDHRPERVVYVSCNPATLARDCAILHHEGGWHIRAAGIMNMFPHTGHVESIAVLEPGPKPEKKTEAAEAIERRIEASGDDKVTMHLDA